MTKPALISTAVQSAAPAAKPPVQLKPPVIEISGPAHVAFAEAAIHIRQGYMFSEFRAPEILMQTGHAILTLVLGSPDQHAIDLAKASTEHAIDLQRIAYQKDVEAAAKQLIETAAREAKQKLLAAQIAAQRATLQKLEREAKAV